MAIKNSHRSSTSDRSLPPLPAASGDKGRAYKSHYKRNRIPNAKRVAIDKMLYQFD